MDYFDHQHYNPDSSPKICHNCKHNTFDKFVVAIDGGHISEYYLECQACDTIVGYWGYGHFDPCFSNTHPTEGP
jgi:hypothetical protein